MWTLNELVRPVGIELEVPSFGRATVNTSF